jgi:hypothetical protein
MSENFYYEAINSLLNTPSTEQTTVTKMKHLNAKIILLHHEEQRLFLNTGEKERIGDENPTLCHFIRASKRHITREIQQITDKDGVTHTTTTGILSAFKNYMQQKFDTIPTNEENIRQMTRRIKKRIPIEAVKEIDDPITMEELHEAVKKGKPNKATGEDGISQEFFKMMWDTIKNELLEVINQMYDNGITNNQNQGVMVCVPKTLRPTKPGEYRHLTLLNTDVKLLTRTLAKRISP